ncbi:histidine kinase cki1 [Phtheirospermum japonicum]|uniref:histidine kinase n=1 Tax=Phtheirospermum japonicum TaxID=374723 RepID=A0A830CUR4_9LAMI|nr:histidine kinase cki1 [Phtheirospermum japonicum]
MKFISNFLADEMAGSCLYLATSDGNVLTQTSIPNTRIVLADQQVSFQLVGPGDEKVISVVKNVTCRPSDGYSVLSVWSRKYVVNCSPFEIAGLKMVYVLAVPENEFLSLVHKNVRLAFVMLVLMIGAMVITICSFVYLTVQAAKREMYLCGALINQMESTRQSERKSMNKSLAFASASHDIRASLAGITGLIEMCRAEVFKKEPLRSEMLSNLQQMEACTRDLLGILNSILDTSKIESGKMQIEEEEFDVEKLLEDVVDLFHPVGMKNLLSNAVKFTQEGHVVVRAWARKPSLRNASDRNNSMSSIFCWLFKIEKAYNESEVMTSNIQRDPNCLEFIFEVIDTGKGIPKEKQRSVFENYVQVKETGLGHEGTGLGLGIVQSLVRLMGGEIGIVDKEVGESGTCFRFNVLFSTSTNNARALDIESNGDKLSIDSFQPSGPFVRSTQSPKTEGSQVLLFMQSSERSNVLQSFMQSLGIKVHVVKQHQHLYPALKKIKQKLINPSRAHSSRSSSPSTRSKEVPLSALDGTDDIINLPSQKRTIARAGQVLVVIDTRAGPFREIARAVAEFRRDLNEDCCSRVVWLNKTDLGNSNFHGLDEDKLPPSDLVISKPFHGSRLYQVIGLLPEFGGGPPPRREETSLNVEKVKRVANTSCVNENSFVDRKCEIEEVASKKPLMGKKILIADDDAIGRKVATFVVSQLGAAYFSCENGEEAWKLVCKGLEDGAKACGDSKDLLLVPFDCILMDCEVNRDSHLF